MNSCSALTYGFVLQRALQGCPSRSPSWRRAYAASCSHHCTENPKFSVIRLSNSKLQIVERRRRTAIGWLRQPHEGRQARFVGHVGIVDQQRADEHMRSGEAVSEAGSIETMLLTASIAARVMRCMTRFHRYELEYAGVKSAPASENVNLDQRGGPRGCAAEPDGPEGHVDADGQVSGGDSLPVGKHCYWRENSQRRRVRQAKTQRAQSCLGWSGACRAGCPLSSA